MCCASLFISVKAGGRYTSLPSLPSLPAPCFTHCSGNLWKKKKFEIIKLAGDESSNGSKLSFWLRVLWMQISWSCHLLIASWPPGLSFISILQLKFQLFHHQKRNTLRGMCCAKLSREQSRQQRWQVERDKQRKREGKRERGREGERERETDRQREREADREGEREREVGKVFFMPVSCDFVSCNLWHWLLFTYPLTLDGQGILIVWQPKINEAGSSRHLYLYTFSISVCMNIYISAPRSARATKLADSMT